MIENHSDLQKDGYLWMQLKAGNSDALKGLYQLYHSHLFHFGHKMTQDTQLVEDAVQETFISLWKYRNSLGQPKGVKQYLFKAFRNHLFGLFKGQARFTHAGEIVDSFQFEVAFETRIIEGEDTRIITERINTALAGLTDRQREIIYFRFFENLSFDEIADVMNMQRRATYKLMARAIAALKELLDAATFQWFLLLLTTSVLD